MWVPSGRLYNETVKQPENKFVKKFVSQQIQSLKCGDTNLKEDNA